SRELDVLRRNGYADFAELYPPRQLAVLDVLRRNALEVPEVSPWARTVALACVIGAAEFAGHATRWDPDYLKPYETLANHRYATPTLSAEVDPWGVRGRGTARRRFMSARKAAKWLAEQNAPST